VNAWPQPFPDRFWYTGENLMDPMASPMVLTPMTAQLKIRAAIASSATFVTALAALFSGYYLLT